MGLSPEMKSLKFSICPEKIKSLDTLGLSWLGHHSSSVWQSSTVQLELHPPCERSSGHAPSEKEKKWMDGRTDGRMNVQTQ